MVDVSSIQTMFRRHRCLLLGVLSTVCVVLIGKTLLKKLTSDATVETVHNRAHYSPKSRIQYSVESIQRRTEPSKMSPRLVWQYGEESHPYFLSPVLQFKNDIYRQRTLFNVTGIDSIYRKYQTQEKLIVFYNMPVWHTMEKRYKNSLRNCPVKSCKLSDSKDLLPKADGVIFYVLDIAKGTKAPAKSTNQMWIFFAHEAPWEFPLWNDLFNWTMTFRYDSDIVCPYFVIMPKVKPDLRDFKSLTEKKSSSVMWLVSHCGARSKRDDYVRQLQQHTTVDIYGECGPLKCSRSGQGSCDDIQNVKYKFYLAFENSLCRGYLTEKLFRCYTLDIIPVVRGGVRYGDLLPRGTYVNTDDFPSPKHLAEHLHYLDSNDTAYAEMLEKKSQYTITHPDSTLDSSLCDICVKLHDLDRFGNSYSDINKWWNVNSCKEATDL